MNSGGVYITKRYTKVRSVPKKFFDSPDPALVTESFESLETLKGS